jgi:hypothetical protein
LAIDQKRFDSIGEREEKKRKRWKGKIIRWHLHSIDSQWSERDEQTTDGCVRNSAAQLDGIFI